MHYIKPKATHICNHFFIKLSLCFYFDGDVFASDILCLAANSIFYIKEQFHVREILLISLLFNTLIPI